MRVMKTLGLVSALGTAMVLGSPSMEWAQESGRISMEATTGRETTGQLQYRLHCASCHGVTGKGDGPVAAALTKKPANLTVLAKDNKGEFPEKQVEAYIDGSETVAAHGTRSMPIWGFVFSHAKSAPGMAAGLSPQEIDERIKMLADYIKSIQEK